MLCCLKQAFLKAHLVTQELWNPQEYLQTRRQGMQTGGVQRAGGKRGHLHSHVLGAGSQVFKDATPHCPQAPRTTRRQSRCQLAALRHHLAASTSSQVWTFPPSSCCRSPRGTMRVFTHNQCSNRMLQSLEEHLTCGQTRTHAELCLYHRSEYKYCYKHHNL